jgi:hypothetical protein
VVAVALLVNPIGDGRKDYNANKDGQAHSPFESDDNAD